MNALESDTGQLASTEGRRDVYSSPQNTKQCLIKCYLGSRDLTIMGAVRVKRKNHRS